MFRNVIISCLAAFGLGACHASAHVGPVHAGAAVHHHHHHHHHHHW